MLSLQTLSAEARHLSARDRLILIWQIVRSFWARPQPVAFPDPPQTGAALVAYWQSIGAIGSRPEITNSQDHARQLRQRAQERDHL